MIRSRCAVIALTAALLPAAVANAAETLKITTLNCEFLTRP